MKVATKRLASSLVYLVSCQVVHLVGEDLVQRTGLAREDLHLVPSVRGGRVSSIVAFIAILRPWTPGIFLRTAHRQPLPHPNREGPDKSTHAGPLFGPLRCVAQLQTPNDDQITQSKVAYIRT